MQEGNDLGFLSRHRPVRLHHDGLIAQQSVAEREPDLEAIIDRRADHAQPLSKPGSQSLEHAGRVLLEYDVDSRL